MFIMTVLLLLLECHFSIVVAAQCRVYRVSSPHHGLAVRQGIVELACGSNPVLLLMCISL